MTSRDFAYWFMGFIEISNSKDGLTPDQLEVVKNHLNLVFKHEIDPSFGDDKKQDELNKIHSGATPRPRDPVLRC